METNKKLQYSKDQIIEAIIVVAKDIARKETSLEERAGRIYHEIIKISGLPRAVEIIVYDMFINDINDYFVNDDQVYKSIQIIKIYAKTLNEHGMVEFNN